MTYIRATLSEFIAIFPAFAGVTENAYAYWATRAERVIGTEFGDDQLHGTMLMTAHNLVIQGFGSQVDSQRWANFAGATRVKSGSLELSWDAGAKTTGSRYGDEAMALIRSVKGGPMVARTGAFPPVVSYG